MSRLLVFLFFGLLLTPWAAADSASLRIGDEVTLIFRGVPERDAVSLSGTYRIGDDGYLKLPYISKLKVAGLTPSKAERALEALYVSGQIYRSPNITISADGAKVQREVTVMGEVRAEGAVAFDDKLTAIGAIGRAKGFSDFANRRKVRLTRGKTTIELDLSSASKPDAQKKLLPGDVLTVSSGWR